MASQQGLALVLAMHHRLADGQVHAFPTGAIQWKHPHGKEYQPARAEGYQKQAFLEKSPQKRGCQKRGPRKNGQSEQLPGRQLTGHAPYPRFLAVEMKGTQQTGTAPAHRTSSCRTPPPRVEESRRGQGSFREMAPGGVPLATGHAPLPVIPPIAALKPAASWSPAPSHTMTSARAARRALPS